MKFSFNRSDIGEEFGIEGYSTEQEVYMIIMIFIVLKHKPTTV